MDSVIINLNCKKTYFGRIWGESFSVTNIFETDNPDAELHDILKTDILSERYAAIYSYADEKNFVPGDWTAIWTGPIYIDKISIFDFKKLDYTSFIREIESYIAKNTDDSVLIALQKLYTATLNNLKDYEIEEGVFYYLNADDFPQSSLSEANVYDYYIIIIVKLKNGLLLRLTFGND